MTNLFSAGVMNTIGQAGEMRVNEKPGEITELISDGISIGMGALAIRQQSGGHRRLATGPNMLANFFGRPTDRDTEYPALVWAYLNATPAGAQESRINNLISRWRHYNVIGNITTPAGKRRIDALTNSSRTSANIDLLVDRAAMLIDVRSEINQMDRDLCELIMATQAL
jgi:hypothetical protein